MSRLNDRPIIFALSNPTEHAECTAEEAYQWSKGKALYAAGVQFPPVSYGGRTFLPGQANNFYIFPAVGMAIYATQPKRVTDEMFIEAAHALADQVTPAQLEQGLLYPAAVEHPGNRDQGGRPRGQGGVRQQPRPRRTAGRLRGVHPQPCLQAGVSVVCLNGSSETGSSSTASSNGRRTYSCAPAPSNTPTK